MIFYIFLCSLGRGGSEAMGGGHVSQGPENVGQ